MDESTKKRKTVRCIQPEGERLLYSVEEAAWLLGGIDRGTVFALVRRGELKVKKIGKRTLLPRQELERFSSRNLTGFRAELPEVVNG